MEVKLFVLHNLTRVDRDCNPNESPDRLRKEKEAQWLARTLKTEVSFFVCEKRNKEFSFQDGVRRGRTCESHAETPGEETEIEFLDRR